MEMFGKIKNRELHVEKVYVYKFSRFMRNPDESNFFKMRLEALGVDVVSVTEPLSENSAVSEFMERLLELSNKFQSDTTAMHVRSAMRELVRRGYWTGGPAPFGYSILEIVNREGYIDKNGETVKRGTLVPEENEARIVRRIFEISAQTGFGGHRIYQQLCAELGSVSGRSGGPLGGRGVNTILTKPIYKGLYIYGSHGYKLVYDEQQRNERRMRQKRIKKPKANWVQKLNENWRIVSDELWESAQRNRQANTRADFGHGPKRASYLLTGMLICGNCDNGCGGHWQHSANSGYHYYCCRGAMHGGDLCDNATKLRGEDLELAIVQSIERNLFSNEFLDGLVAEILELRSAYLATISDRSALQKRRDELTLEIERLTEMAAKLPDITEIANKIGGRQNERTQVDQQLATTAMPPTAINPQRLRDDVSLRLTNTLTLLKSDADVAARRIELQKWIETIRIDGNGEVWIKWKQTEFIDRIDASQIGRARKVKVLDGWSRLPLKSMAS